MRTMQQRALHSSPPSSSQHSAFTSAPRAPPARRPLALPSSSVPSRRTQLLRCSVQEPAAASGRSIWDQVRTVQSGMMEAVAVEDFGKAAKLRDQCKELVAKLPAVQQFLHHTVERLRVGSSLDEKLAAIHSLGEAGNSLVVPDLVACLKDEELHPAAQQALWAVFGRSSNPEVMDLMVEGLTYLEALDHERALETFRKAAALEPDFAEAHNKMATAHYLLERFEDSISSISVTLRLQPLHFGALSGKGLCHLQLKQYPEALDAFIAALAINPRMPEIQKMAERISKDLQQGGSGSGDRSG